MNPYAVFDRSAYPFITITFTGAKANRENFSVYLNESLKNYERGQNITLLFDATEARFPPLKYQRMQAKWLQQHQDLIARECLGIAYTIPHATVRLALKLIFTIQKQPVPFRVFASNDQAIRWLKSLG